MLAVYSEDPPLARRTARRLEDHGRPEVFEEWTRLLGNVSRADHVVVAAPEPGPGLLARMEALKQREPGVPFLLVTHRNPEVLRHLKNVVIEEVLWTDELDDELALALRRSEGDRRLRRIDARLREASHLSPTLVAALGRAALRRPPLTSVRELAAEIDRDRRTLWHHWRESFDAGASDLTPKGFLDWVLVLRARAAKTGDRSWSDVARELGVHTRTLRRVAGRRLGAGLEELADRDLDGLLEVFEREVMVPLLHDPSAEGSRRVG